MARKNYDYYYTRQYHIKLTAEQILLYYKAIDTQNKLYQYALRYMYKTYGCKHVGRPMPDQVKVEEGQKQDRRNSVNYLINYIKAQFIKDKFKLKRWSFKKLGLSSHAANEFLKTFYTNFSQYRKQLVKASKMTKVEKYNYQMNITKDKHGRHKNSAHKSWYRKGSMKFLRNQASFRTITSQVLPNKATCLLSKHHINLADFGDVIVYENLKDIAWDNITLTKIKQLPDGTFRLQICFGAKKQRLPQKRTVGADWNMFHNKILHTSDNQRIYLSAKVAKKANLLEDRINQLKSQRDLERNIHGQSKLWYRLDNQQRRLFAKRANLLTNEYRHRAHDLVDNYDTIIVEKLNAYDMRKLGKASAQSRGINRRLALLKPYELMQIIESLVNKQNKTLIKVDSFKTSQVEFGTNFEFKHPLDETDDNGERTYISKYTGKRIDRDLNAALNIKEWGLHPEKHIKLKYYPDLEPTKLIEKI